MTAIEIQVSAVGQQPYSAAFHSSVDVGRQRSGEPSPCAVVDRNGAKRLVVAPSTDKRISQTHVQIHALNGKRIAVRNTSRHRSIYLVSVGRVAAGESAEVDLPTSLTIGEIVLYIRGVIPDDDGTSMLDIRTLAQPTLAPGASLEDFALQLEQTVVHSGNFQQQQLIHWLSAAMQVLQSAASSPDFLHKAVRTVVEIVALDRAASLRLTDGQWHVDALYERTGTNVKWNPSQTILDKVHSQRRTLRQLPKHLRGIVDFQGVDAIVVSPILDNDGQVIGALYGERHQLGAESSQPQITELEAILVEVLACGVAAGLARVEKERAAIAAQVQFEQFFTADLARSLRENPRLLEGRDAEVSVLFCDVRGFSRISERLGAQRTMLWIGDVMGELSECVLQERGVLVNYIGDELMAMWGAPDEEPHHAQAACLAAIAMLRCLPKLNERWQAEIGAACELGIGVSTGTAHVGNMGTQRKLIYGPLGNTVNLSSRVQGATKFFGTSMLVSESTARALSEPLISRRLSTVRLVNIQQLVDVFEVTSTEDSCDWHAHAESFAELLALLDQGNLDEARTACKEFLDVCPTDGPAKALLGRIEQYRADGVEDCRVWELSTK